MRLSLYLLLLVAGLFSPGVWAAACNGDTSQMTINFQNIKYQPSLRDNTQMTSLMADSGSGLRFTCDQQAMQAGSLSIKYAQTIKGKETNINGRMVFESAVAGIGYSLGFQCNGGPIHYLDGAGMHNTTVCSSSENPSLLRQQHIVVKAYVTFYKTGTVVLLSGNHTNSPPLPNVGKVYVEIPGSRAGAPITIDLTAMNVEIGNSASCYVKTSNIVVDLGRVNRSDFKGVGTKAGSAKTFTIPVWCSQPADIKIAFFGTPVAASMNDTLAIKQVPASAKGVGIKLSYGNNGSGAPTAGSALHINDAGILPTLGHVTANKVTSAQPFNFVAQMVQTEATVSAGSVNSTSTFVLQYN
ncbi:fimbrial protein [Atlantibacter sp.]|uniref:fimbrial protein n=1 Tax=Atlantibacter sp. TaxID=1903473 RepID=UPI0028AFA0E6|nr:fimbrial protein [Atlantibacter sp.]